MGREVRRVPAAWEHPKYPADHYEPSRRGRYIPLYEHGFSAADAEWNEGFSKWGEGLVSAYGDEGPWRPRTPEDGPRYTDWSGPRPSPDDYMPDWPDAERTHLMMYEDTSEGTPISPAFPTPEELARWLADNDASAFAESTATYEQWLRVAQGGWAPSMVVSGGVAMSGVAALSSEEQRRHSTEGSAPETPAEPLDPAVSESGGK